MRTVFHAIVVFSLGCLMGCDIEAEAPETLETIEDPVVVEQVEVTEPMQQTDIAPPSAEGLCDVGRWEYSAPDYRGCGLCTHTLPDPDRPGNLAWLYKRWCWIGPGCGGCGQWVYAGSGCYDICQ